MGHEDVTITGRQELKLRRRLEEVLRFVVEQGEVRLYRAIMQMIMAFVLEYGPKIAVRWKQEDERPEGDGPERDFAEERRAAMQEFYRGLGIEITVPKPAIASNRQYRKRREQGQELFYRLSTSALTYARFMEAARQGQHWTVVHDDRHRIKWEDAAEGYWFWAEVQPDCPRLRTPWNTLISALKRLISLEEYVIVWWFYRKAGEMLDVRTWTWLRTRYNFGSAGEEEVLGALNADGCVGQVGVHGLRPGHLGVACVCVHGGGRCAEVVGAAA